MIALFTTEIADKWIRENFRRLKDLIRDDPFFRGRFKFFQITVDDIVTERQYRHGLGYVPKDVLTTSISGADIIWHYDQFTSTHVVFSTSGATTIRAYIGRYEEG